MGGAIDLFAVSGTPNDFALHGLRLFTWSACCETVGVAMPVLWLLGRRMRRCRRGLRVHKKQRASEGSPVAEPISKPPSCVLVFMRLEVAALEEEVARQPYISGGTCVLHDDQRFWGGCPSLEEVLDEASDSGLSVAGPGRRMRRPTHRAELRHAQRGWTGPRWHIQLLGRQLHRFGRQDSG